MTAKYDDLIARLAAASEPDPHRDADIEAITRGGIPAYRCRRVSNLEAPAAVRERDDHGSPWHNAPSFTGSLDAALTLVPEGHRWLLDKRPFAKGRQDAYRAEVYRDSHPYRSDRSDVPTYWGPTPALALCIAALKARSDTQPEGQG